MNCPRCSREIKVHSGTVVANNGSWVPTNDRQFEVGDVVMCAPRFGGCGAILVIGDHELRFAHEGDISCLGQTGRNLYAEELRA